MTKEMSTKGFLFISDSKMNNPFVLFSLAAAYTHYYCLISVAFFYVTLLVLAIFTKRLSRIKIAVTYVCTVVGYLPWFFILLKYFMSVKENFWIEKIPTFGSCIEYLLSSQFHTILLFILFQMFLLSLLYEIGVVKT